MLIDHPHEKLYTMRLALADNDCFIEIFFDVSFATLDLAFN